MVIGDLDIEGVAIDPPEADSPLVVYMDAILTCPITLQRFQSIPERNPQICQVYRVFKKAQLAPRNFMQGIGELLDVVPLPYGLCHSTLEAFDHTL
jgi:hypothetical protein